MRVLEEDGQTAFGPLEWPSLAFNVQFALCDLWKKKLSFSSFLLRKETVS